MERMFPMVGESRTRGHSLRIESHPFKTEMQRNFLSQRVVNLWNYLPHAAVEARSLGVLKAEIDRFLIAKASKVMGRSQENEVESDNNSAMMKWQSRLDGSNGLILFLYLIILWSHLLYLQYSLH